jgi:Mn-dependent DtxR family transcriptional regulator
MKKLTRRQREMLSQFLDLYNQEGEPLHYSVVAEHLGIGPVSAYEMLRLLEGYRLVQAEYRLPEGPRGPGRASVVFRPTPLAARLLADLASSEAGAELDSRDWQATKEHILSQLEAGRAAGYENLLEELLARAPDQSSPLIYAAEMITTIILTLHSLTDTVERRGLGDKLRAIGKVGQIGLSALVGLGLGLSMAERANRRLTSFLLAQSERFESVLQHLNEDGRRQLVDFTREAMRVVGL